MVSRTWPAAPATLFLQADPVSCVQFASAISWETPVSFGLSLPFTDPFAEYI